MKLVLPVSSFNERPLHTIRQGKRKRFTHTHQKDPISLTMSPFCARLIQSSAVFYTRKRAPPFYLLLDTCTDWSCLVCLPSIPCCFATAL